MRRGVNVPFVQARRGVQGDSCCSWLLMARFAAAMKPVSASCTATLSISDLPQVSIQPTCGTFQHPACPRSSGCTMRTRAPRCWRPSPTNTSWTRCASCWLLWHCCNSCSPAAATAAGAGAGAGAGAALGRRCRPLFDSPTVHRPTGWHPASSAPQVRWQFPSLDSLLVVGDSDGQTLTPQAVVRLCFLNFCALCFICLLPLVLGSSRATLVLQAAVRVGPVRAALHMRCLAGEAILLNVGDPSRRASTLSCCSFLTAVASALFPLLPNPQELLRSAGYTRVVVLDG